MELQPINIKQANEILQKFHTTFKSLELGTISAETNGGCVSYAPMIKKGNAFYILIAEIAPHFSNILKNNQIGGMLIESEKQAKSVFFRKRVHLQLAANILKKIGSNIKNDFIKTHGQIVNKLLQMGGFHFVKLDVLSGVLVLGPGQAFVINNIYEINKWKTGNTKSSFIHVKNE